MGEVWVARQTEPVKRKVALKLIKTGMDSRAVLSRFEQERQALALMDHPNIARLFDGGLTPTGQPFFVMELVNGLPLTKFCDEVRLTLRKRLEVFVPICQGVQHAHQKGIVHRDLKPANILITLIDGRPVPKVIDFGVAKATAGKLTDETLSTQFGAVVGTFEYMAPEQAGYSGDDIDTRADIYSLGVILYELLTGLRPLDNAAEHILGRPDSITCQPSWSKLPRKRCRSVRDLPCGKGRRRGRANVRAVTVSLDRLPNWSEHAVIGNPAAGGSLMSVLLKNLGIDQLTIAEKIDLVQAIWDCIADEVERLPLTEGQRLEVDRRLAAHRANPQAAIPWEQVEAEALARLRR